jgi:hypothetical protein
VVSLDRLTILRVALEAQLDPRTVKRAIEHGIDSLQSAHSKVRLRAALKKLKLETAIQAGGAEGEARPPRAGARRGAKRP